ncbi:GNAT family N-acetyltransferase [bacterium]|nr:GNAT family N-acetyltransferase [bacterium]
MNKSEFNRLLERSIAFTHTSLQYLEFEDLAEYELIASNDDLLLLRGYDAEARCRHYHWAANKVDKLLAQLPDDETFLLTFVPPAWVPALQAVGLTIRSQWHDYFRADLADVDASTIDVADLLSLDEVEAAASVTQACRGQSRGFTGQTADWFRQWLTGDGTVQTPAVITHRGSDGDIVGIVCTGLYGQNSEKGAVVWIREVALTPAHQGQGIGRRLVAQALSFGKAHGAGRAFLAVDERNLGAIHLYESMDFVASEEPGEINMMKET